jgi:hypothetical protein
MMAIQAQQAALGPYGQTATTQGQTLNKEHGNLFGDIMGIGQLAVGAFGGGK